MLNTDKIEKERQIAVYFAVLGNMEQLQGLVEEKNDEANLLLDVRLCLHGEYYIHII